MESKIRNVGQLTEAVEATHTLPGGYLELWVDMHSDRAKDTLKSLSAYERRERERGYGYSMPVEISGLDAEQSALVLRLMPKHPSANDAPRLVTTNTAHPAEVATKQDLVNWLRRLWTPDSAKLEIWVDVDSEQARAALDNHEKYNARYDAYDDYQMSLAVTGFVTGGRYALGLLTVPVPFDEGDESNA